MLIIWGLRVVYHTITQGVFYCRTCGGDRSYRKRAGRRYITLFFIPVVPLNKTSVHVQCVTCKTRYVTEVLNLPTAAQMQAALPAGARALVSVMLRAGDPGCARRAAPRDRDGGRRGRAGLRRRRPGRRPGRAGRHRAAPRSRRSAVSSSPRHASGTWPNSSGSRWRTAR